MAPGAEGMTIANVTKARTNIPIFMVSKMFKLKLKAWIDKRVNVKYMPHNIKDKKRVCRGLGFFHREDIPLQKPTKWFAIVFLFLEISCLCFLRYQVSNLLLYLNNIEENAKKPITIKNPAIDIFCVKSVIGNIEKTAVVINIKVIKSTIRSTTREETAPEKTIFCFLEIPYARSISPILRGKMLFPIYPTMVTLYRSLVEALPTLLIKICHRIARIQTLNTSRAIAAIRTK